MLSKDVLTTAVESFIFHIRLKSLQTPSFFAYGGYSPFESDYQKNDFQNKDYSEDGNDNDRFYKEFKQTKDAAIESDQTQETFDYFDEYKRELKCADRYSNCASYAWVCKKTGSSYRSFQQGCRKTCGFCKPDAPPAYVSARPGISLSKKRDIMKACLDAHNAKRRLHQHTPSMIYSQKLADRAQTYAEYLRDTDKFDHDDFRGYGFEKSIGENLYWSSSRIRTPEDAVDSWYNEIKNYNFRTGASNGGVIGHFTQLVWQRSNILGCGVATSSRGTWIVARYGPAGNTRGSYKANVHPLKVNSGDAFFDNRDEIIL